MKVVVTGANGQLGWSLAQRAGEYEILAFDHDGLDITDAAAVQHTLENSGADVVINAAAYTAVDKAEQEPELAFAVNCQGPRHLASACADLQIPLLHVSTDYVFDGTKRGAYRENDPAAPLGVYGRSKWEGEEAVRQALAAHIILRVSWVFSEHGHNFVKTMLRLAGQREQLKVVADQQGCPTYAGDIATVLLTLAERVVLQQPVLAKEGDTLSSLWGTYHYCSTPPTTWHGFAQTIVALARAYEPLRVTEIMPISTQEYPTPAARPLNSVLDCTLLRARFGIEPNSWQTALGVMLKALRR